MAQWDCATLKPAECPSHPPDSLFFIAEKDQIPDDLAVKQAMDKVVIERVKAIEAQEKRLLEE